MIAAAAAADAKAGSDCGQHTRTVVDQRIDGDTSADDHFGQLLYQLSSTGRRRIAAAKTCVQWLRWQSSGCCCCCDRDAAVVVAVVVVAIGGGGEGALHFDHRRERTRHLVVH